LKEDIKAVTEVEVPRVLAELVSPRRDADGITYGTIERAAIIFFFLEWIEESCITNAAPVLISLLKDKDVIIAMESERVLKSLLPLLEHRERENAEYELASFSERVTRAIIGSKLIEISD
jgi:hypothetical protein